MLKLFRYALAAMCLATSVGCLALWQRSQRDNDRYLFVPVDSGRHCYLLETRDGYLFGVSIPLTAKSPRSTTWQYGKKQPSSDSTFQQSLAEHGMFRWVAGRYQTAAYMPLWFPSVVSMVGAVAVIRVNRQFTLRSALVGMSVVAALMGMAVAL